MKFLSNTKSTVGETMPFFLPSFLSIPKSERTSESRQESNDSKKNLRKNYSNKPVQVCPSPTNRSREDNQNTPTTPNVGMLDIEKAFLIDNMNSTCSELSSILKCVMRCRFWTVAGSFEESSVEYDSEDEDATVVASNMSCRRSRRRRKRFKKSIESGVITIFSKKSSATRQRNVTRNNGRRYWKL